MAGTCIIHEHIFCFIIMHAYTYCLGMLCFMLLLTNTFMFLEHILCTWQAGAHIKSWASILDPKVSTGFTKNSSRSLPTWIGNFLNNPMRPCPFCSAAVAAKMNLKKLRLHGCRSPDAIQGPLPNAPTSCGDDCAIVGHGCASPRGPKRQRWQLDVSSMEGRLTLAPCRRLWMVGAAPWLCPLLRLLCVVLLFGYVLLSCAMRKILFSNHILDNASYSSTLWSYFGHVLDNVSYCFIFWTMQSIYNHL
jgi:hypothetical protein